MTIYDFKIGETYFYFHYPYHLYEFKVHNMKMDKDKKKSVINTDRGPFFFFEGNSTTIENYDAMCYCLCEKTFFAKKDKKGLAFIKKKVVDSCMKTYDLEYRILMRGVRRPRNSIVEINKTYRELIAKIKRLNKTTK